MKGWMRGIQNRSGTLSDGAFRPSSISAVTIPSPSLALAYVGVFGAGSIAGMVAMSALLGLPLVLAADRFARAEAVLRTCAGIGSIVVGVALGWRMA